MPIIRTQSDPIVAALSAAARGAVTTREPLASRNTWKVGGHADVFFEPADVADLAAGMAVMADIDVDVTVLGRGSNALVSDAGVRGLTVHLGGSFTEIEVLTDRQPVELVAGGGTPVSALLRRASTDRLAGVEMLTGVPGSVGGAVRMNAGTHLGEVKDSLLRATVVTATGSVEVRDAAALGLVYRNSALTDGEIVVEAVFGMTAVADDSVNRTMREVKERRRRTQPVNLPSGGSTFKNPEGHRAWALIDGVGLRGHRIGGAQFSEVHSNFITTEPGATAADVAALIRLAQQRVLDAHGIELHSEVSWLGEWPDSDVAQGRA